MGHTFGMLLAGTGGNELELSIVGYQFPDVSTDPWDSNWLLVSVRVVTPRGSWDVVDPCLTTWEAKQLVRWLVSAATREPSAGPVNFTEPNLTFVARAHLKEPERIGVQACFQLELRPPWAPGTGTGNELCVELEVERADLARAAASLLVDLLRFPQRGDDPTL